MNWEVILRLMALAGIAYGAYDGFKRRPKAFEFEGRTYCLLPDGRFCTRWGRIVRQATLAQALREFHNQAIGLAAVAPPTVPNIADH